MKDTSNNQYIKPANNISNNKYKKTVIAMKQKEPNIYLNNNIIQNKPNNIFNNNINYFQDNQFNNQMIIKEKDKEDLIYNVEEDEKEEEIKEIINKKCSLDEHNEIDAIYYCQECKISMCNKCEKVHSGLLKKHHTYSLDKNINEIFTGLCTKPNHSIKLEFYCNTHNQLCCAACISKIKVKGHGKHKDCKVCLISKIKNIKKQNLEQNVKLLEGLSNELEPSIKELKNIYEKINESKEKLKGEIQQIFTKIRNELNKREDQLYSEIDEKYNELFFKERLIKESEKLPNLVKISLEKGKIEEKKWEEENNLSRLINDCINIENTIKNINDIYDKVKKFNSNKELKLEFYPKNDEVEQNLLNEIKNFGGVNIIENDNKNKITIDDLMLKNDEEDYDDRF